MRPRWPRYAAALIGVAWYLQLGGLHTLNPLDLNWLLRGDWLQHLLGWLFFRHEPWTFPLGTLTALPYPVGSTIGFTDSNPLVSILLKPFSGWLPDEFQFIGPWLAFCFAMQGYFGAALASTVTRSPLHQILGGALFAISPVLAARLGHDTLCAQWLLLGLMYVGLREYADAADARRGTRLAIVLAGLSAAIHPYLAAMSATLALAGCLRLWRARAISGRRAIATGALTLAVMFAVMFVIGYFTDAQPGTVGFEHYAADLVTLIDSANYSRLVPEFHLQEGRWEGFGFLGAGVFVAVGCAIVAWLRTGARLPKGAWVFPVVCLLMAFFALSATITLADRPVARLHHVFDSLDVITKPFRASGRFIWPLHYLITLWGIWGVSRVFDGMKRAGLAAGVLFVAIASVQAADFRLPAGLLADKHFRQAPHVALEVAEGRYQHLGIFPAQIRGACGGLYEEDHVYRFMLEAYRLRMTFNSGNFARMPLDRIQQSCGDFYRAVDAGMLDPQTIFVLSADAVPQMKAMGAACGRFDGDWLCVGKDSDEGFRTYLTTGRPPERKSP